MLSPAGGIALVLTLCFGPAVLAIYMPVVPAVQAEFGITRQVAQLSLSVPLTAVLLAPVIAGLLVDRIGRKRVMLASALISGLGCLLSAVTSDYSLFLVGRIIAGLFSSLCLVVGRAVISDVFESHELSQKVARFTLAPIIAMMIAPVVGALLIDFVSWRMVFWLLTAVSMLTAVLIATGLPETLVRPAANRVNPRLRALLGSVRLWAYVFQSAVHYGAAIGFCSAAAYIMQEQLGSAAWEYSLGLILVLIGLGAGVLTYEKLLHQFEHGKVVFWASFGTFGLASMIYLGIDSAAVDLDPMMLFAPAIFMSFGIGLALPPSQAGILLSVKGQAGAASGVSSALQMLSAAVFVHLMTLGDSELYAMLPLYIVVALGLASVSALPLVAGNRRQEGYRES